MWLLGTYIFQKEWGKQSEVYIHIPGWEVHRTTKDRTIYKSHIISQMPY